MTSNAFNLIRKKLFLHSSRRIMLVMPLTAILFIFSFQANAAADFRPGPASPEYKIIIQGKVTDEKGQALEGATISVKGAATGAKSDANGNFSIEAGEGATLVISYIGYNTTEVKVNGQSSVSVQLEPSASVGQHVVVIGYGTQSKKTLTGAISVIDNDVLKSRPAMETTNLLQGVSAGLQITRSNTGNIRGSVNNITIRGITSRSAPGVLVVVDGIPQAANDATALDNINPEDIDNISILKDGQAAIYGARAAGGGAARLHFRRRERGVQWPRTKIFLLSITQSEAFPASLHARIARQKILMNRHSTARNFYLQASWPRYCPIRYKPGGLALQSLHDHTQRYRGSRAPAARPDPGDALRGIAHAVADRRRPGFPQV